MRAARWDTDAEIGGAWWRTVKRVADGTELPLDMPCTLDIWAVDANAATVAPHTSVTGVLADDEMSVTFTLNASQVTALGRGAHEYRLTLGDPVMGPLVPVRGFMNVRGRIGDL